MAFINRNDLLLTPISPSLEYYPLSERNEKKNNIHWGQFKLLFNEIAFLNYFYSPSNHPRPIVVYAGAAPGTHIRILVKMFPQILRWYLYDPRDFYLTLEEPEKSKVEIHQSLFTNDNAQEFARFAQQGFSVFLISDIRTANYLTMTSEENEKAIMDDNNLQMEWVKIINPIFAHLKFRLPYFNKYPTRYVEYYDGIILKQPWAPQTSSETRLVLKADAKVVSYDIKLYEDQLFYFNRVVRERNPFKLPFISYDNADYVTGELLNDFDSMITLQIIADWLTKNKTIPGKENVEQFYRWILNELNFGRKDPVSISRKREFIRSGDSTRRSNLAYVDEEDKNEE